jgi:hypothetical protein
MHLEELLTTIPLKDFNKIIINPIANNNIPDGLLQILEVDNNFNESLIPLLTTVFEKSPQYYKVKSYIGNDTITLIKHNLSQLYISTHDCVKNYMDELWYVSFLKDIMNNRFLNSNNIVTSRRTLVNMMLKNDNLVRMYNEIVVHNVNFVDDIILEEENIVISWLWYFGSFEIILLDDKKCKIEMTLNIIEDNNVILSRKNDINKLFNIFDKLKYILNIDSLENAIPSN